MLDRGERPNRLTENQKKYLIRIGPYQPILQRYHTKPNNTNTTNESRKQSRFNASWFKEYPHHEYSLAKDAAFCFVCCLFGGGSGAEKAENAWKKDGVRSWHKFKSCGTKNQGKLANHFLSTSHKSTLLSYAYFAKTSGHIDALLDKTKRSALIQEEEDLQQNRRIIEILLDISKAFGRQGLSPPQRLLRTRRGRAGNRKARGERREEGRKREKPLPDNVRFSGTICGSTVYGG